jgi:hypothetical protein
MRRRAAANPGGSIAPAWLARVAHAPASFDGGTPAASSGCRNGSRARRAGWQAICMATVRTGPGRTDGAEAMPTDIAAAIRRRAAERARENAAVLLLPVLMCIVTVVILLEDPAFAATFRQFALF